MVKTKTDAWSMTGLLLFIYVSVGLRLSDMELYDGAVAWFVFAGMIIWISLFLMWDDV